MVERKVNGMVLVPCKVVVPVMTRLPVVPKFNVVLAVVLPAVKFLKIVVAFKEIVWLVPVIIRLVEAAEKIPLETVRLPERVRVVVAVPEYKVLISDCDRARL